MNYYALLKAGSTHDYMSQLIQLIGFSIDLFKNTFIKAFIVSPDLSSYAV